jgi:hypothetical protein
MQHFPCTTFLICVLGSVVYLYLCTWYYRIFYNLYQRQPPWFNTIGANKSPVIVLQGEDVEISGCDIFATWQAIEARGSYGAGAPAHSARFALIRNNTIWHGSMCFWFDQVQQVSSFPVDL